MRTGRKRQTKQAFAIQKLAYCRINIKSCIIQKKGVYLQSVGG